MDRSFIFNLFLLFFVVASTISADEINGGGDDDLLIKQQQVVSSDGDDDLLLHAEHHFSSFKARFGKSYGSSEEHDYRFGVFKANLRRAKIHQKLDRR
nr:cysteine proteinase 15a [Quercus suber]